MRIPSNSSSRPKRWSAPGRAAVLLCAAAAFGVAGCGGGGGGKDSKTTPRVSASGKVQFDGKPVPAGTVTFINIQTGNPATCEISNGSYSSPRNGGPNPGDNSVTIIAKEKADGHPMWAKAWTKQHVQVGEKEFKEDFTIKADEVKPFDPKTVQDEF